MNNNIQSIKDKLKNYSKKHNKIHQATLTRYFQERLLYRLSKSDFKDKLLLKGGALIYSFQMEESRPTLDIDLLAKELTADHYELKTIFKTICDLKFYDGVTFDSDNITVTEITKEGNYSGIRIKVPARLGNIKQSMQIDIGFGDIVTPGPVEMEYPTIIDMESPKLMAYSVESLLSEKFQAMIDLAEYNSRMKDFYDVYTFLNAGNYDEKNLREATKNTFEKRKTSVEDNHSLFKDEFYKNKDRITQWKAFLKKADLNTGLEYV
jgi:predicted nucleotidyltransferase component of viral defense system